MEPLAILDLMMRGGAAGVSLILAATLAHRAATSSIARFGALFAFAAACYAFISAPVVLEAMPLLCTILKPFAISTGVLFWWFALAMFCDQKRWAWSRLIPFLVVFALAATAPAPGGEGWARTAHLITESITVVLMIHVIVIIALGAEDDLVEPRRKFRTVWSGAISLTVLAVCANEIWSLFFAAPPFLSLMEAALLLIVTSGATLWSLSAEPDFFPEDRVSAPDRPEPAIQAADRHLALQLREAMAGGVYQEPGLTVGALAERLGAPEHRLRAVINQQLGYRNFANFLNEHRIAEARRRLENPADARRQILQLALDLGYGSIAPFNRAFRDITGVTPTQYRRAALSDGLEGAEAAQ
ncbi:MAG: helix-turn-helix domain-containing protein [Oceanicaulis sp.]